MGIDDTGHHACEYDAEAPEAKPGLVWEGTTFRAGARPVLRSLESGSLAISPSTSGKRMPLGRSASGLPLKNVAMQRPPSVESFRPVTYW